MGGVGSAASRSLNDPESVAASLGYVTQAVLQLASILDVPLRQGLPDIARNVMGCHLIIETRVEYACG